MVMRYTSGFWFESHFADFRFVFFHYFLSGLGFMFTG